MRKLLKDPNPLNVFEMREHLVPAPHFQYTSIPLRYNLENSIHTWIKDHLKGRYYLGRTVGENQSQMIKIGFEDAKELSFFILACPLLKYS